MRQTSTAATRQIAIVGMAALFPAAPTLDAYWRNLIGAVDAITDVPADRWDELFYDPEQAHRPDRVYCRRGGFIAQASFEPLKFGLMPASVGDIEPDHLLALEVAAAAIEDAGGAAALPDPDRIGVILGRGGYLSPGQARFTRRVRAGAQVISALRELLPEIDDERLELVRAHFDEQLGSSQPEGAIGVVPNLAASRIANRLDLRGPAYTVDAACASSLLAVDQAVSELAAGRLDAVLAGGVHHVHDVSFWSVFSQLRALSRQGVSKPFNADADGLLIGEGTGMIVLKRLADAEHDGDRVYAVIKGVGTSSDGRSASMFNPASSGQVLAIRRAWADAELDPTAPDALGLLEAHGTATPAGDTAELSTLAEVFGPHVGGARPVIGSVKSMIGHTMPAAGIAGLIKAALAVHHGVLPPTLHCDNPRAELARTRFAPIAAAQPWPGDGPRRAGINAFGFGGINAHVIIEQHQPPVAVVRPQIVITEPDVVLWLAAPDPAELNRMLEQGDDAVRELGSPVPQQHAAGTRPGPVRLGLLDPTGQRLAVARRIVARQEPWRGGRDVWFTTRPLLGPGGGKLAFVFPGVEAEFAPRTADVAAHFGLPHQERTAADLGQHGTGLVEVGRLLDQALRRMNIVPDAVAGHSIGEWTAALVSGQMSAPGVDAFMGVFDAASVEVSGYAFAAVSAGADSVTALLGDYPGVLLSHDNAPSQCVVNGPREQVQRLVDGLRARNVLCQLLPFRSAFHTPVFAEGLQSIAAALGRYDVRATDLPVWSGTLAAPYPDDPAVAASVFTRHMVEPVWFRQTVNAMYDAGIRVFLQVGAGQLASLIDDNLRDREHLAVPVNLSRRSGLDQLRRVATALWVDGGAPDLRVLDPVATTLAGPKPERSVVALAAHLGPAVRLELGGPLIKLGAGAADLLGPGAHRLARPTAPAAMTTLLGLAQRSSAAAEVAALLQETTDSVVAVLQAAARPPIPPTPTKAADDDLLLRRTLTVSLEEMPYLLDHCFFVQPADWPEVEDRYPVVPATTVIQHMMDAAEQACPGLRATGVREARFNRWLPAAPPVEVDVTVRRAGPGLVLVTLSGYARALVEVSADYPAQRPPAWWHDPATERPATVSAEQMYAERRMFHGPLFQGVTAVHAIGERHIRGVVTTPAAPGALLDNALQLIGNWLNTTQPQRTVALPVGVRQIRFFGPAPAPGTALECVARVASIDHEQLVIDVQLSHAGQVVVAIDGAADRRFDSHPIVRAAEQFPDRNPMSTRHPAGWTAAFDYWTDLVAQGMSARNLLGAKAYAEYERLPAARRKHWLLGRIAVKDAVRFQQWDAGQTGVYPIELTVDNEPSGAPRVTVAPGHGLIDCAVSLAHCGQVGVAIAAPVSGGESGGHGSRRPGIDVVELVAFDEPTITYALGDLERDLLDRLSEQGGDRNLWFARFWAAKEAVGKSRGTGLAGAPRQFVIQDAELSVEVGGQFYRVHCAELENPPDLPPRRYVVGWTPGPSHTFS